jgi:hypothetical protein
MLSGCPKEDLFIAKNAFLAFLRWDELNYYSSMKKKEERFLQFLTQKIHFESPKLSLLDELSPDGDTKFGTFIWLQLILGQKPCILEPIQLARQKVNIHYRSIIFKMSFWGHRFDPNTNGFFLRISALASKKRLNKKK